MSDPRRFWAKVERTDGCWLWRAALNSSGYGWVHWNDGPKGAHRVAYELLVGPIPDGLQIDHLCRVRNCVNPAHLEPVTQAENIRRGDAPAFLARHVEAARAISACPHGHPYDETNTIRRGDGGRMCRTCNRARCAQRSAS